MIGVYCVDPRKWGEYRDESANIGWYGILSDLHAKKKKKVDANGN